MFSKATKAAVLSGLLLLCNQDRSWAQSEACLVPAAKAPRHPLAYAHRDNRCEGILPRYVGYGDSIELIGYLAGKFDDRLPMADLRLAAAAATNQTVTVRALGLTSSSRYQMDAAVGSDGRFRWPLEVLEMARNDKTIALDTNALGIVACSNRCALRPDTVFFPISSSGNPAVARQPLVIQLRSDISAKSVRVTLRPIAGGLDIDIPTGRATLNPDELTRFQLPSGMQPGEYRLDVRATNEDTQQPMSPLLARIVVP